MSARVISFRSALHPATLSGGDHGSPLHFSTRHQSSISDKVLPMSRPAQTPSFTNDQENSRAMFAKVQSELADRYVEVEIEGLTLRRLGCIYLAAVQGTRIRMLQGVRSLFHLNPAH